MPALRDRPRPPRGAAPGMRRVALCAAAAAAPAAEQAAAADASPPAAAAGDEPHAAEAGAAGSPAHKRVKRNVALHVGYVGTGYTGLQANRQLPQLSTIEGVLEAAILAAGLIKEANFGDFRKSKWSRSSRTDKGVHSLATVIGLRAMLDEGSHETDPEGIGYVRAINAHLPQDVCVFAVQRTNKSFNARRWCGTRTYEYYLPAHALALDTPDASSAADQAKLALLRDVLQAFCGYRPYHCYAGNRSQYVGQRAKAARRRERRAARNSDSSEEAGPSAAASDAEDAALAELALEQQHAQAQRLQAQAHQQAQAQVQQPAPRASSSSTGTAASATATTSSTDADGEGPEVDPAEAALYAAAAGGEAEYSGEGPVPPELQWRQQIRFLSAPDPDDPVVKSHYRLVRSFTADDPVPLVPGGVPCLRLEVCGDSFMLHQIRHMVGAAVAIVRGIMPRELLEVSLSAPGRITLPRAPPHSLLLSVSAFSPFPAGWGLDVPLVARFTGDRLALRERGQAELRAFRARTFDRALNELLLHPDWDTWSRRILPRFVYAPEDAAAAAAAHATWFAELKARRAAAAAAATAEAAASLEGLAVAVAVAGAAAHAARA